MKIGDPQRIEYLRSKAKVLFNKHSLPRWSVFLFDGSAVFLTFLFSYLLRYNFEVTAIDFGLSFKQSMLAMGVYCGFSLIFRSFVGLIRHTTIRDIFNVIITTTASLITLLLLTVISRRSGWDELLNIPLSIILIHYVSINAILFTVRILIKMFYELVSIDPANKKNVIIFGAGVMGVIVKGVIMGDNANEYNIVAFLDNNKHLQGKKLSGIPVLAPKKLRNEFLEKFNIETMIFAIKNIPPSERSEIFSFAVYLGLGGL